ncbi:MAG TPA: helix-turn-helix domain-containing protein [Candidatus Dormibacteraeota bacterium]|jgi:AraC-like DNA-binding protein|nr:helix-turn-helix domain-containing protein [Candidatus Dormibacteraeota bacterium]
MPTLATDGKNEPVTEVVEGVSRRLALARAAIESGRSLARAAAEPGFADPSHMTRQVTRTYGLTPGRWMALTAASSPETSRGQRSTWRAAAHSSGAWTGT